MVDNIAADKIRQHRIKCGECPTCQRKTHKVSRFRKREPLTVEGKVLRGICLRCNPLTQPTAKSPPAKAKDDVPAVPNTFVCDDDFTVASEITLDTQIQYKMPKRRLYNPNPFIESVSEETAMTNFGQHDNHVPTNILGSQRGGGDRESGQPTTTRTDEEDEDEDKKWIAAQRRQRFHPLSREMYLFNSERSLGIESNDGSENSTDHVRSKTHPLSKDLHQNSERSLTISMIGSEGSTGSDGKKNKGLMQGSTDLLQSEGKSGQSDQSLTLDEVIEKKPPQKVDNRRAFMNREMSTTSVYSTDTQMINRLMQGSVNLLLSGGQSDRSLTIDEVIQTKPPEEVDNRRAFMKREMSTTSAYSTDTQKINRLMQGSVNLLLGGGQSDRSLTIDEVIETKPPKKVDNRRALLNKEPSTTSISAVSSASGFSSDTQKINSLVQGSANLLLSGGKSDRSLTLDEVAEKKMDKTKSDTADDKELSANSMSAISNESGFNSDEQRIEGLLQFSSSLTKKDSETDEVDLSDSAQQRGVTSDSFTPTLAQPATKRRQSRFSLRQQVEPNRFSLSLKDMPRRKTDPTFNFEMEMRNSRNWNSVDILRDAAAEANGEKFNLKDFAKEMEAELLALSIEEGKSESVSTENEKTHSVKSELEKIANTIHEFTSSESSTSFASFQSACGSLVDLALHTENYNRIDESNVIQILCGALHVHSSEKVMLIGCKTLANLSKPPGMREIIAAQGGISTIFATIQAKCPEIDREAFRAFGNLSNSTSKVKQMMASELDTIIATFYLHKEDKYIQSTTCSIFQQLSKDRVIRAVMIAFPEIFDILAIILRKNPSKKKIEAQACLLLRNLSLEENGKPPFRTSSFISFIMKIIPTHAHNEEVVENCCFFLAAVGSKQPNGFSDLCTEEGIICIVNALKTFNTSPSLLESCCAAICAVTSDSEKYKRVCLSVGAVDAIIGCIVLHPYDKFLLESALRVLVSLSSKRKCVSAIVNSEGIGSIVASMRSNPRCSGVIKNASRFILSMLQVDKSEVLADQIISAGGISVFRTIIMENENNSDLRNECELLLQILDRLT